jgi:hypothetical protein
MQGLSSNIYARSRVPPMTALDWLLAHPRITLTAAFVLIAQALAVLIVRGGARADRVELGERRAVER